MCCQVEHCRFYKGTKSGIIIVIIAMDDLTLASNSPSLLLSCKLDLQSEFENSDVGEIHWLLGVEIKRDRHAQNMTLSQKAYIDAICTWFRLQDMWPATTLMEAGVQLTDANRNKPHADFPYKEIVRLLMYVATAT